MNPLDFIGFTPKSNCGECGHPACLAFAVAVTKGGADPKRCPYLDPAALSAGNKQENRGGLEQVARGQEERDMALVTYLKSKVRPMEFSVLAPRLGAAWDAELPDMLRFRYLGREVELGKVAVRLEGGDLIDPRDQILLYNYVSFGGGQDPQGNWVGLESLPNSISKVRTLAAYCEQPLAKHFSAQAARLAEVSRGVDGLPGPAGQSADFGTIIPVLPHIPIYLLFWDEDPAEGFGSRVKVLFDKHVLGFLDIESLIFAAERMAERLVELARISHKVRRRIDKV